MDLTGKICLVTGASRGIGKGVAAQLAYYGATCYITGRNLDTLEKLRNEVKAGGGTGKCIPIECDHGNDDAVEKLFRTIDRDNDGRLDMLVNNAYSAVGYIKENSKKKFWEQSPDAWDVINNVGLRNQYRCAVHASKLMVERRQGVIINISSIGGMKFGLSSAYGIGKAAQDRMAYDCAQELKPFKVAFISLWPGVVKTEELIDAMKKGMFKGAGFTAYFDRGETPAYVGRAVAALVSEPHPEIMNKSGKILMVGDVGRSHGIVDEYGVVPAHRFQVNVMLKSRGYNLLSNLIPDFVRIPLKLMWMLEMFNRC